MTPNQKGGMRTPKGHPLDLYEAGDSLAPELYSSERIGQTATHSDRTLPDDTYKVIKSGWIKPSIQLGALLYLRSRGDLTLGGKRRLHRLLNRISPEEVFAALRHQEKISKSPQSFEVLLRWIQRPLHLRQYFRKERRRIGVGYRDKGSLPPSHSRNRVFGEQGLLYLGEEKEFLSELPKFQSHLVGVNGILLFHHVSDGWWRILSPFERFSIASRMLEKTLAL
jgi:hypothetical protein